ncbi:MAG: methionine--tRNA ligase subunit beta, partial [Butyrivibrio sp.]|nr:methionine--tRNA ligase subunit beta [Butyrivibrio sp.]
DKVEAKMDELRVADALTEIFALFKRCNKYIDETEPWILGKDESKKDRLSTVLYNLAEAISIGAALLDPFMPETAQKIKEQLSAPDRDFDQLGQFGLLPNDTKVSEAPEMLFARKDLKDVLEKAAEITKKQKAEFEESQRRAAENLAKAGLAPAPSPKAESEGASDSEQAPIDIPAKEEISYEQFGAMQFQVGEIIKCEAVEKSKKLLCSQVKIGSQVKQIVSGIRKYYTPEEMVGKKVMVLVNLKPAKLAGVLSEGMLLCAEDAEGNLALMTPEKNMPSGAEIC